MTVAAVMAICAIIATASTLLMQIVDIVGNWKTKYKKDTDDKNE